MLIDGQDADGQHSVRRPGVDRADDKNGQRSRVSSWSVCRSLHATGHGRDYDGACRAPPRSQTFISSAFGCPYTDFVVVHSQVLEAKMVTSNIDLKALSVYAQIHTKKFATQ